MNTAIHWRLSASECHFHSGFSERRQSAPVTKIIRRSRKGDY